MKRHNVFNIDNEVMYAEYLALLVYSHKNSFKKYYFTILLFLSKNCSHDEQKRLSNLINYLIQNIRHLKIFSESFYCLLKETHLWGSLELLFLCGTIRHHREWSICLSDCATDCFYSCTLLNQKLAFGCPYLNIMLSMLELESSCPGKVQLLVSSYLRSVTVPWYGVAQMCVHV